MYANETQQTQINDFIALLKKWNDTYNLTSITDDKEIYTQHILDSLSIAEYLDGKKILDIGTGAGFPGIPLAIYFPEKQFTLLDSNGKKTRFLVQTISQLKLSNVIIVNARAELWKTTEKFDDIVTRATMSAKDLIQSTTPLLKPNGYWLLMKGQHPELELQEVAQPARVERLNVPGLVDRNLIIIQHS